MWISVKVLYEHRAAASITTPSMLMTFLLALEKPKAISTRKLVLAVWNLFGEKTADHLPSYFVYLNVKNKESSFYWNTRKLLERQLEGNSTTRVTYNIVVGIFSYKYLKESFKRGRIIN